MATRTTVSILQAAGPLGISRTHAYHLAQLGSLPGVVKLGGTYRVSVNALASTMGMTVEQLLAVIDEHDTEEVAV